MHTPFSRRLFVLLLPAVWALGQTARAQFPVIEDDPPIVSSNGLPIGVPETTGGVYGEPLNRYDVQYPWAHGYFQEMPAYGGFAAFRPYNYKHVFSQSQAAGGWGMPPAMPYAQQFWHRYRKRAKMVPEPTYSSLPARARITPASARRR